MDFFTERERDVIKAIMSGFTDSEAIATQLKPTGRGKGEVSEQAVRHLVSRICAKTGCRDRTQIALWAMQRGFDVTWTGPVDCVPLGWTQTVLFSGSC